MENMDRGIYRYALVMHARRSVCECGHAFTFKREARITASSPVKCKRALESMEDTLQGSCKEDGPHAYSSEQTGGEYRSPSPPLFLTPSPSLA